MLACRALLTRHGIASLCPEINPGLLSSIHDLLQALLAIKQYGLHSRGHTPHVHLDPLANVGIHLARLGRQPWVQALLKLRLPLIVALGGSWC